MQTNCPRRNKSSFRLHISKQKRDGNTVSFEIIYPKSITQACKHAHENHGLWHFINKASRRHSVSQYRVYFFFLPIKEQLTAANSPMKTHGKAAPIKSPSIPAPSCKIKFVYEKTEQRFLCSALAPPVGLEPTTFRLTAERSTN